MKLRRVSAAAAVLVATGVVVAGCGGGSPSLPTGAVAGNGKPALSLSNPGPMIAHVGRLVSNWTDVTSGLRLPNDSADVRTALVCDLNHRILIAEASSAPGEDGTVLGSNTWSVQLGNERSGETCPMVPLSPATGSPLRRPSFTPGIGFVESRWTDVTSALELPDSGVSPVILTSDACDASGKQVPLIASTVRMPDGTELGSNGISDVQTGPETGKCLQ